MVVMVTRRLLATKSSDILQVGDLVGMDEGTKEDKHQTEVGVQIPAAKEVLIMKQLQQCNKRRPSS